MKLNLPGGASHTLKQPRITIGSAASNDIVLSSAGVSETHAVIEMAGSAVLLSDAGSERGTLVNGLKLKAAQQLRPGDRIMIGDVALLVQGDEAQETMPEPIMVPASEAVSLPSQPAPGYGEYPPHPIKDKSLVYVLEILPWFFGLLGFGWIYAGNTTVGIILIVSYLLFQCMTLVLDIATAGISLLCTIPIDITILVVSAVLLSQYVKKNDQLFR